MADDYTTAIEYGIEWIAPDDIAGKLSTIGTGQASKDRAEQMLRLIPGQQGRVVERLLFWSDWMEATGSAGEDTQDG